METIEQYFERQDTPAKGSPVGALMIRLIAKRPEMSFNDARAKANEMIGKAAKARVYRQPTVLSPEAENAKKERTAAFYAARRNRVSGADVTVEIPA